VVLLLWVTYPEKMMKSGLILTGDLPRKHDGLIVMGDLPMEKVVVSFMMGDLPRKNDGLIMMGDLPR